MMEVKDLLDVIYLMDKKELCVPKFNDKDIMKLFLCRKCQDIVKCQKEIRTCECGECSGYYLEDGLNAIFSGKNCVPLGVDNNKLIKAVQMSDIENKHQKEPTTCSGVGFDSFVILDCATTIKRNDIS